MAGSYNHIVKDDGSLRGNERALGMLDCYHGDVYECIEEMYGMIWWLAAKLADDQINQGTDYTPPHAVLMKENVERARKNYRLGLEASPTQRYQAPSVRG